MNFFNQNVTRMISTSLMDWFAKISIEKYSTLTVSGNSTFVQRKIIPVPIQWGTREKFVEIMRSSSSRKNMNPSVRDLNPVEMQWILPRISCNLTGLSYDSGRRLIKTQKIDDVANGVSASKTGAVYSPAPYTLDFEIATISRNLDENLQIMEQILPYFSPTMSLSLKLYSDTETESIPVTLTQISVDNPTDIPEFDERIFTNIYTFSVKVNYYIPKKLAKIIYNITTNIDTHSEVLRIDTKWVESMNVIQSKFSQYQANTSMANPLFAMKSTTGLTSTYAPKLWSPEEEYIFMTSALSAIGTSPIVAIQNDTTLELISPALSAVTTDNIAYQNAFKIYYQLDNDKTIHQYIGTPIPINFSKIRYWHIFSTGTDALQFYDYIYFIVSNISSATIFSDIGNGLKYQLLMTDGILETMEVTNGTPVSIILYDVVTGLNHILTTDQGDITLVETATSGVLYTELIDNITGITYRITIEDSIITTTEV